MVFISKPRKLLRASNDNYDGEPHANDNIENPLEDIVTHDLPVARFSHPKHEEAYVHEIAAATDYIEQGNGSLAGAHYLNAATILKEKGFEDQEALLDHYILALGSLHDDSEQVERGLKQFNEVYKHLHAKEDLEGLFDTIADNFYPGDISLYSSALLLVSAQVTLDLAAETTGQESIRWQHSFTGFMKELDQRSNTRELGSERLETAYHFMKYQHAESETYRLVVGG